MGVQGGGLYIRAEHQTDFTLYTPPVALQFDLATATVRDVKQDKEGFYGWPLIMA